MLVAVVLEVMAVLVSAQVAQVAVEMVMLVEMALLELQT
jgi:hypothetical protein